MSKRHIYYSNNTSIKDTIDEYKLILNHRYGLPSNRYIGVMPKIKNVKFHDPATIVFWGDGTKTVVKCGNDDIFDPEKGLAMAIAKRAFSNRGNYYNEIRKWTEEDLEKNSVKKRETNNSKSLYYIFAHDTYDVLQWIRIPYHDGLLNGYFDNDSMQWIYAPDDDFVKYDSVISSNNDQQHIVTLIKNIFELRLSEHTHKNITVDVQIRTTYDDPACPYLYTVSLAHY